MAQPTPYTRLHDFSDYQEVNPTKPLRGSEVDAELDAVKLTTDQLRANIGLIQRDDGALANQSVTPESLSAGALAMIHQGEYVPRGAWAAATAYALGDVVTFNASTYLCLVAHTSVVQFANDLAADKWLLIANGALAGGNQAVDLFSGNGSQTAFTLTYSYAGSNAATVFVGGVAQIPVQDFTISGTTLTFVIAPPAPSVADRKNVMVQGTGLEAQLVLDEATASAANAAASALAASNSATAASGSVSAAAAIYDSFDDRYLGAKAVEPTLDNDGNALLVGAIYFNTVVNEMRVWSGSAWQAATALSNTVLEYEFLATAGQTTYAFAGQYRVGFLYVWVNGVMLSDADITATDGTNITFASALSLNDEVRVMTFKALGSVTIDDIVGLQDALNGKLATSEGAVGTSNLASSAVTTEKLDNAAVTAAKFANGGAELGHRNRLINANPIINQRGYLSGTATTTANQYTLDRWRVVTSGQNVSWTDSGLTRTLTCPSGGLEQVIESLNIEGGTFVLNWIGTATATVNGTAVAKGGTFTLPANTNATVRFSSGTLAEPQLEAGTATTPFERRPYGTELVLCHRYAQTNGSGAGLSVSTTSVVAVGVSYSTPMRAVSTVSFLNFGFGVLEDPNVASRNVTAVSFGVSGLRGCLLNFTSDTTTSSKLHTLVPGTLLFSSEL
jgi:hypothetical protein